MTPSPSVWARGGIGCVLWTALLFSRTPLAQAQSQKVLVGTSMAAYALAYSPARHLFYHDGWYAFYHDGSQIVGAFSENGISFGRHQFVSHIPAAVGFSVYEIAGTAYLLYTDNNYMKIFLRKGKAEAGMISWDNPILIIDTNVSFGVASPTLEVDKNGILWVVYRSSQGVNEFCIWIIHSQNAEATSWGSPIPVSNPVELKDSGAGTSGAPALVSDRMAVVFSGAKSLYMVDFDSGALAHYEVVQRTMQSIGKLSGFQDLSGRKTWNVFSDVLLHHSVVDSRFSGVHDFSIAVNDKELHLVYLKFLLNGDMVAVYKKWNPSTLSWGTEEVIGNSEIHTAAIGIDQKNRVWTFLALPRIISFRIKEYGASSFNPPQVIAAIYPDCRPTYFWLSASGSKSQLAGLLWIEGPHAPYQVFFEMLEPS